MKTLFICQEPLLLVIIPFIIMTLMFDSLVILGVNYTQGLIGYYLLNHWCDVFLN